jgi:hypothetical protein
MSLDEAVSFALGLEPPTVAPVSWIGPSRAGNGPKMGPSEHRLPRRRRTGPRPAPGSHHGVKREVGRLVRPARSVPPLPDTIAPPPVQSLGAGPKGRFWRGRQQPNEQRFELRMNGTPGRTRTCDLWVRNPKVWFPSWDVCPTERGGWTGVPYPGAGRAGATNSPCGETAQVPSPPSRPTASLTAPIDLGPRQLLTSRRWARRADPAERAQQESEQLAAGRAWPLTRDHRAVPTPTLGTHWGLADKGLSVWIGRSPHSPQRGTPQSLVLTGLGPHKPLVGSSNLPPATVRTRNRRVPSSP